MVKHYFPAVTLFAVIVLMSCYSNKGGKLVPEPNNYKAITDTVAVMSHTVSLSSLSPMRMFVAKNHLVVANNVKTGHVFNIYPLPLGDSAFSAICMGRGPGELVRPDFKSMVEVKDGFMVADADNLVKYFKIESNKVRQSGSERLFEPGPLNGIIRLGSAYVNFNFDDRSLNPYEFVVLKPDGTRGYISEIPNWDKNVRGTSVDAINTYPNMHVSRPKGDRLAEFYSFFRRVRILDTEGNVLSETSINYPTSSDRVPFDKDKGFYCTYGLTPCASDTRIVAMAENNYRLVNPDSIAPLQKFSEFQIWDWEGHLLKRLITNTIINQFTVDFKTGILYGINRSEDNNIYSVEIKDYLK